MKLKEWGLMRHKGRKVQAEMNRADSIEREPSDDNQSKISSATVSVDPDSLEHRTRTGGWQVVSSRELEDAQPTFMGMLSQMPK
jgi:hypothetical protein